MSLQCYIPNGKKLDAVFVPCNMTALENGKHSACCVMNDLCTTNGLCRNPSDDKAGRNFYYREGCTDQTFQDAACPRYCIGNEEQRDTGRYLIFNCLALPATKWACNPKDDQGTTEIRTAGCDQPFSAEAPLIYTTAKLASISRATPDSISSSLTSSSPTAPPSSTSSSPSTMLPSSPQPTTTPTQSTATPPPQSSSQPLKIGLGVGISLGVLLLATLAGGLFLLLQRRSHARRRAEDETSHAHHNNQQNTPAQEMGTESTLFQLYTPEAGKLPAQFAAFHEVEGRTVPMELEAESWRG